CTTCEDRARNAEKSKDSLDAEQDVDARQLRGRWTDPRGRGIRLSLLGGGTGEMPIKLAAKSCSVAAIALLVCAALGPANWAPRSGLGWQVDHFVGYLALTCLICFAWPRPFLVGGALMTAAVLLEALQAFTPDRKADVVAALCGASGALAATLVVVLFMFIRMFIRAQWVAWAQPIELGTKSALPDY